jgi:predicted RNase H-like HicB family nuclease
MRYSDAVLIEKSANNYGAWAPDLPGCITTGPTVEETLANMREAIEFHLEGMREDGDPIPEPSTIAAVIDVAA